MVSAIFFIFGTIVGSFLNVVALRWPLPSEASSKWEVSNFAGRSKCIHCHQTLRWYELVPIVSFLVQRAKCRRCGGIISFQYPLVEIFTGLVFASLYYVFGPTVHYLLFTLVFCIYIVILIYDSHHKIIPDELVYFAIALALIFRIYSYYSLPTTYYFLDFLAGPIIFAFFASIWFLSGGRAMGFGDAKLGLSAGFLLGASQGFLAIVLAFWIGALLSVLYMLLSKIDLSRYRRGFLKSGKKLTMKSEIPFAPFIIIGAWVSLIFSSNILNVLL